MLQSIMANEKVCLNCRSILSEGDIYCPSCGQDTKAHLLSFHELFSNFWNSFTNLDNSVFNTLKYIWAPWLLTSFYVSGRKKSFLNPVRVFLITLIFHFGLLISAIDISSLNISKNLYTDYEERELYIKYNEVKVCNSHQFGSEEWSQIDTTLFTSGDDILNDTITNIEIAGTKFKFSTKDLIELNIDSINNKYHYTTYKDKLLSKQIVRGFKDPEGTFKYILSNLIWAIVLTILLIAGFFKLIYRKMNLNYVEHLVFLLNVHSLAFILNSVWYKYMSSILTSEDGNTQVHFHALFFIIPTLIFFISLYKYYKQSFGRTLLKSILVGFVYFFANIMFIIGTLFISFLIF